MGVMQAALESVGYKPTIRPRDLQRRQERQDITELLEKALDGVFEPLIKQRKVLVKYQGGIYKARFDGMPNVTFANTPAGAESALKYWGGEIKTSKTILAAKFNCEEPTRIEVNEDGNISR